MNIIEQAIELLESQISEELKEYVTSSESAETIFKLKLATKEREEFHVMFLDTKHGIIKTECLAIGTIDSASVYPREIARDALLCNAKAVILSHNHPSGDLNPSNADKEITGRIKQALDLFDIRLLDHIIVARKHTFSFANNGLI